MDNTGLSCFFVFLGGGWELKVGWNPLNFPRPLVPLHDHRRAISSTKMSRIKIHNVIIFRGSTTSNLALSYFLEKIYVMWSPLNLPNPLARFDDYYGVASSREWSKLRWFNHFWMGVMSVICSGRSHLWIFFQPKFPQFRRVRCQGPSPGQHSSQRMEFWERSHIEAMSSI